MARATWVAPPCLDRELSLIVLRFQDEDGEEGAVDIEGESEAESETGEGRGRDPNAMTQEEEDDFTRELAKMMVSTNAETRKVPDRKPVSLDVGIPLFRRQRAEAALQEEDAAMSQASESKGMQFTLLTKRGNKPQVRANRLLWPFVAGPQAEPYLSGTADGDSPRLCHCSQYDAAARAEQGGAGAP